MAHHLSEIIVSNFKSIKDESFGLSEYTPLIGYNNAGKTNILEAIEWVLKKSSLPKTAFNTTDEEVSVVAIIEGVSEEILESLADNHRASIEPFVHDEKLSIKRVQLEPGVGVAQIRLFVRVPNPEEGQDEWQANPAGIDNAIKDLFPDPIHIGAMENSEEDVSKSKTTTTIGKLLAEIIEPLENTHGEEVRNVLQGLKNILDADGENRAPQLTAFDTEVNEKISSFFPDVSIKIHVPTPELKDVFAKGTIKVYENQMPDGRDVSALGHGGQRSIQMALIRHLADLSRDADDHTTTLLLIDEPELYLHPQAIEIVRQSLKTLSGQRYQVVFTTHSPFMITSRDVAETILIRKNDALGTHKRNSLKSAVPQIALDAPSQLTLLFSLSNSSNILFAEKVILAEGKTENRLLPALIEKVTNSSLGIHKLALVPLNGSGSTRKAMRVLEVMDLPTKAIVDFDYALKHCIEEGFLPDNDPDILACHDLLSQIAEDNDIALGADGWPTKVGGGMTAAEAFTLLASQAQIQANIESLKAKLLPIGLWFWTKGTIEDHLNITGKTEQVWANFNHQLEESDLNVILPNDYEEIEECINWIVA